MALNYLNITLFEDPDYEFTVSLQRTAFRIRLYYIEREQRWAMDLMYGDRTPIVNGAAVVADYPMFLEYYIPNFPGFFWFEPVGKIGGQALGNPFELSDYYRMIYYYETEDEDDGSVAESNLFSNCWNGGGCN